MEAIMEIVRVEHYDTGLGPWRHPYSATDHEIATTLLVRLDDDRREWPGPGEDGINEQLLRYTDGWYFGFESDASMLTWFNQRDLELLHGCGFLVTTWEIEEKPTFTTMRGERQVAFRKHAALRCHTLPIIGYL